MLRTAPLLILVLALLPYPARADDAIAQKILALTSARTKLIWVRGSNGKGGPFGPMNAGEATWHLMSFDTADGRERELLDHTGAYSYPQIAPSGRRVLWTEISGDRHSLGKICVMDWDGKNKRDVCDALLACGTAEDPPGTEWVYLWEGDVKDPNVHSIFRRQIDKPSVKELVWDKTYSNDKWGFTRDGKMGASGLPWPRQGIASLPNGDMKILGEGCGGSICPDGSKVLFMRGDHRGIFVAAADGSSKHFVDLSHLAGMNGNEAWHCAWALYDPRFFTFGGPHPGLGTRQSQARIHFCQFNADFTGVAADVQVTQGPEVDTQAMAWIDSGTSAPLAAKGPADGLDLKLLAAVARQLQTATRYQPILDRLNVLVTTSKNADEVKEAKEILDAVDAWAKSELARAKDLETNSPPDAQTAYRALSTKLAGTDTANAADQRLKDKDFQTNVKAWPTLQRILAAEHSLKDVPGSKPSASDAKYAAVNRLYLDNMKNLARGLQKAYPHTLACDTAAKVLAKYDLALDGT